MAGPRLEPPLARDRDPFDRTLETLRQRLAATGPLQGAALPISALADDLGVSPTPVREALARLAGEGLVARTPQGYAAPLHDPAGLADLYGLASVLACAALSSGPGALEVLDRADPLASARAAANRALAEACARVRAQLAPLAQAEAEIFGREASAAAPPSTSLSEALRVVRRHYARRAAQSGRILAVALGLLKSPRI